MKKILIVDDQIEVQELLQTMLEVGDYLFLSASNGAQALQTARRDTPDLMLLDVRMPNSQLNGLEVCYRLKSNPATAQIKIIMLSAYGQQSDIDAGILAGADDYICKPFSPAALMNKIKDALRKG